MAQLELLKKKRSVKRGLVTKLEKNIEDLMQSETVPTVDILLSLKKRCEQLWTSLKDIDESIEPLLEIDEFETDMKVTEEYSEVLLLAQSRLEVWEAGKIPGQTATTTPRDETQVQNNSRNETTNSDSDVAHNSNQMHTITIPPGVHTSGNVRPINNSKVRLPKLELTKFDGRITSWPQFYSRFLRTVHYNTELVNSDRFTYLKASLSGSAQLLVASLDETDENYSKALELLVKRYDKPEVTIQEHIRQLLSMKPVKEARDHRALRQFYDGVMGHLTSLQTLRVDPPMYETTMLEVMDRCLPLDIKLGFKQRCRQLDQARLLELSSNRNGGNSSSDSGQGTSDIENSLKGKFLLYLDYLLGEIEILEECSRPQECAFEYSDNTRQAARKDFKQKKYQTSAAALTTQVIPKGRSIADRGSSANANMGNNKSLICLFCKKNHHASKCGATMSVAEREQILQDRGRCFRCFRPFHSAAKCKDSRVKCADCGGRHYKVLCKPKDSSSGNHNPSVPTSLSSDTTSPKTSITLTVQLPTVPTEPDVLLMTVRSIATGPKQRSLVRVMFDPGSQRSFIREEVSRALGFPVLAEEDLFISRFGQSMPEAYRGRRVRITLKSQLGGNPVQVDASEVPEICANMISVPSPKLCDLLATSNIRIADRNYNHVPEPFEGITVLLGADVCWRFMTGEIQKINDDLAAINTILGWCVSGPVSNTTLHAPTAHVMTVQVARKICFPDTNLQLQSFWDLEHIGIEGNKKQTTDDILQETLASLSWEDNRVQVRLPYMTPPTQLKDNREVAENRLKRLLAKLQRQPLLLEQYKQEIHKLIQEGHAEPSDDKQGTICYHMPHRAVLREDKATSKIRVVFDASSALPTEKSLNEFLATGPNLNPLLLSVMIRFRLGPIGLVADIQKAFLQIKVHPDDRSVLRFLWPKHPEEYPKKPELHVLQMARLPFGLVCSPFLLAAVLQHLFTSLQEVHPFATQLRSKFYVDDLLHAAASVEDACEFKMKSAAVLEKASMVLHRWNTNNPDFRSTFHSDQMDVTIGGVFKVLGILWNTQEDVFQFSIPHILLTTQEKRPTKRALISLASQIYDPAGWLAPYVVQAKCLMQKIWQSGIGWDDAVPEELCIIWQQWVLQLQIIKQLKIPRYVPITVHKDDNQLHIFCDASSRAYGAVAYLRVSKGNMFRTWLLMAKSRVAPIKELTIPRLELMAAVIGTRLSQYLLDTMDKDIGSVIYWSDSLITLFWLKNAHKRQWLKPFVEHRVQEVRANSHGTWRYCPTQDNPADLLSRGVEAEALQSDRKWWDGPSWLVQEEVYWPDDTNTSKASFIAITASEVHEVQETSLPPSKVSEPVLNFSNFSCWGRLLNITAWVYRFKNNCSHHTNNLSGPLTQPEVRQAETYWIKFIQASAFMEELQRLLIGRPLDRTSILCQFRPFLDEGLIRMTTRLQFSEYRRDMHQPILLPAIHPLVTLIIEAEHRRLLHAGVTAVLAQLRERFFIIRGRQVIKNVLQKCVICRRLLSRPLQAPAAPLPPDRIRSQPPFQVVGLDFAGPLIAKSGEQLTKVYILLITCATTRAVHLELVSSQTTSAFILAFRRFIARRGLCSVVYSDNARTFHRADKDLKALWRFTRHKEILEFYSKKQITWKFIVERGPWWGGFWERLVSSIKSSIKKTLGRSLLNFEELTTVLCEVESILNSRPLTFVYGSPDEPDPLTPGHFLIGRPLVSLPPTAVIDKSPSANEDPQRRWKYRQRLLSNYWSRWIKEYLMQLRTAHHQRRIPVPDIKPGDVVLIHDEALPRLQWKMGVIEQCFPGRDGAVRACAIRVAIPKPHNIRRPVQRLYPLEFSLE